MMIKSVASLQARLLNISKERNLDYSLLLNRLGAEQFLYRLSISSYADKFVFKGGSLLTYLLSSERKTKDLDFSIQGISNQVDEILPIIKEIVANPVDDGFVWKEIVGETLNHPDMKESGVRLQCRFLLGKMRGSFQIDLALGDVVEAVKRPLERMVYRGQPFFDEPLNLLTYPAE